MSERTFSLSAYPLAWPEGWRRTVPPMRKHGTFKRYGDRVNVSAAVNRILEQLSLMRVSKDDVLVSTNIPSRLDGMPRSDHREPDDPGVAVYWRSSQNAPMKCLAIDIYNKVADNLAACAATLEAMRAIERHGGAQVQERTFRGFAALTDGGKKHWRAVLGIAPDAPVVNRDTVEAAFRSLAMRNHPDYGGSDALMAELNRARAEGLEEIGRWQQRNL